MLFRIPPHPGDVYMCPLYIYSIDTVLWNSVLDPLVSSTVLSRRHSTLVYGLFSWRTILMEKLRDRKGDKSVNNYSACQNRNPAKATEK